MLRVNTLAAVCFLSFGSIALAAPSAPPPPQVAPALVKVLLASAEANAKIETLAVAKSIVVHSPPPPPKGAPAPATLTAELVFDTSKEGVDVNERYIKRLKALAVVDGTKNRPPIVTFTGGFLTPSFEGVIVDIDVQYTLFLPAGQPCRATVTIHMKEGQRCDRDSTCPSGQVCRANHCVTPPPRFTPAVPSSLAQPSSPAP